MTSRLHILVLLILLAACREKDPKLRFINDSKTSPGDGTGICLEIEKPSQATTEKCASHVRALIDQLIAMGKPDWFNCKSALKGASRFLPSKPEKLTALQTNCCHSSESSERDADGTPLCPRSMLTWTTPDPASAIFQCMAKKNPDAAKCADYVKSFTDQLVAKGDPVAFDCRMALRAARRFSPTESERLMKACCPLQGKYGRDEDGSALCPRNH